VDDKRRSCFDSALRATLSTNGIPVRREQTVRPERSGAKSKGEPHSALLFPPQIKKDSYSS
jgi:organic hydroperoxide reductase OsmC/OhrA